MLGQFAPRGLNWNDLADASVGASGAVIEQVCLDAKRTAVIAHSPFVDETELFRRLGLALALGEGRVLASVEEEMCWLREWDKKQFSLRELARLYGVTTRVVNNALKEGQNDGDAEGAST